MCRFPGAEELDLCKRIAALEHELEEVMRSRLKRSSPNAAAQIPREVLARSGDERAARALERVMEGLALEGAREMVER